MSVLNLEMEDTDVAIEGREGPCEYQILHARNTTRLKHTSHSSEDGTVIGIDPLLPLSVYLDSFVHRSGIRVFALPLLPLLLIALWFGVLGNGALRSRRFPALTFVFRSLGQWLSSRLLFPWTRRAIKCSS